MTTKFCPRSWMIRPAPPRSRMRWVWTLESNDLILKTQIKLAKLKGRQDTAAGPGRSGRGRHAAPASRRSATRWTAGRCKGPPTAPSARSTNASRKTVEKQQGSRGAIPVASSLPWRWLQASHRHRRRLWLQDLRELETAKQRKQDRFECFCFGQAHFTVELHRRR